jgi:uncharacterized protein (TIGR02246 family)
VRKPARHSDEMIHSRRLHSFPPRHGCLQRDVVYTQSSRSWTILPRSGIIAASGNFKKMGSGSKAVSILSIIVCLSLLATPIAADSKSNLDTINEQKVAGAPDPEKEIYDQMMKMVDAWNRHDLDAYLDGFLHSDDILMVVDGETIRGWDLLSKAFHSGYPNRDEMGTVIFDRVQVQMLSPDLGFVLIWYSIAFPKKKQFGTDTVIVKKVAEGWREMISHTSFVEP